MPVRDFDGNLVIVSSHAPVRGHPASAGASARTTVCFKSCPREGASVVLMLDYPDEKVSSHAPVRGHLSGEK